MSGLILGRTRIGESDIVADLMIPIVPTAARVFTPTVPITAFVRLYQGGKDAPGAVQVRTRIVDEGDTGCLRGRHHARRGSLSSGAIQRLSARAAARQSCAKASTWLTIGNRREGDRATRGSLQCEDEPSGNSPVRPAPPFSRCAPAVDSSFRRSTSRPAARRASGARWLRARSWRCWYCSSDCSGSSS